MQKYTGVNSKQKLTFELAIMVNIQYKYIDTDGAGNIAQNTKN
jgi:hypothetical protein